MKKMNGWMKILVFFPPLLFVLLIGWIALNELGGTEKGKETVSETSLTASIEESSGENPSETLGESEEESQRVTEEPTSETAQASPVHLLFAGDILLSDHVTAAYNKAGGINGVLDDGLRSEISGADIFMANEEFPFSDRGTAAKDKQYTFRSPTSKVSIMNEIGVDIVSLANNHSLDFGTDALVDTCTALDGAGIKYAGAGPNMDRARQLQTIEVSGKTIGFLAASRVYPDAAWVAGSQKPGMVSGYDPTILLEEIQKAQEACDYLVVYIHWGIERDEKPQDYQRALGK
ncbi:MAG: CapA family protein, partial [Lacrimispora sp.]